MRQDEFNSRYIIKLSSSILIVALNMIIQLILPRAFTVEEYGFYSYNLNVFTSIVTLSTLSAPNALTSKFSKRNEEIGIVTFYFKFYLAMAFILNIIIIILYSYSFLQETFTGQTIFAVLLGLESAIVLRLQTDSIGIFDAMAISRYPAAMQIMLKVIISTAVIAGYIFGKLNLIFFYIAQIMITLIISFTMICAVIKEQKRKYPVKVDHGGKKYLKEYCEFCKPLVLSNVISQFVVILMNWVLMRWSGVTEQAIFGAAWQLNTLVSYVFSPYAELSKREFSVNYNDREALKHRYIQSLKLMMWLTSYFAIFIGFASEWILPIVYGTKYASAVTVTILIMFYTIYQAGGQVSGAFLLAIEKTKISALLGIVGQLLTLGFIFIFQIPNFIWLNGLGSTGMALTYLFANVINVCLTLAINSKILNISYAENLLIQCLPLIVCSTLILVLRCGLNFIWIGNTNGIYIGKIMISGMIYSAVIGMIIWNRPQLLGISKDSIKRELQKIKRLCCGNK